jgi:HAD superfamily hydrolase (TIGR01450 family)
VRVSPRIRRYDHVLLDLDGCVWVGDEPCDGAVDAVAAIRDTGASVLFLTNDVRHAPEDFVRKLWRLGFQASLAEIVTAGAALQFQLAGRERGSAFVVGSQALVDHVAAAGMRVVNRTALATRADVVVVAAHRRFDFEELKVAVQAVLRGAELVGLNRDATVPMPDGPWPASGSVLAAVEAAVGAKAARVMGKPAGAMYDTVRDRLGAGRCLAVGDNLATDIAGARRAGIDTALVLTGVTSRAQADTADPRPTHVADSLGALVLGRR